jgi:Rod binding domain-containing protein
MDLNKQTELRGAAKAFVAQAFFSPMLKQVREGGFKSETGQMLSGGRGGEAFAAMLDQHRAQHMARSAGDGLVDAIVNRLSTR